MNSQILKCISEGPDNKRVQDETQNVRGVFFSNGQEWHEQRRFALRHLKDFGFGKAGMEETIMEEVEKAIKMLSKGK